MTWPGQRHLDDRKPSGRVLVVSIDGLAPRAISRATMPRLCQLARSGAGTFAAETVDPPLTLPAHASMLRGVNPDDHGVTSNVASIAPGAAWSFLRSARQAGLSTAVVASWHPMLSLIEPDAITHTRTFNGAYDPGDDAVVVANAAELLRRTDIDVAFAYLTGPDLTGHEFGWDSPEYLATASRSDADLGMLLDSIESSMAVIVTTDHGGEGRAHDAPTPLTLGTFMVVRSQRIPTGSLIEDATVLDVAPTVADLVGAIADPAWKGRSVVDRCVPLENYLINLLQSLSKHGYGERVDMLAHSLQTAATAEADGADNALVLAALFHDIGHLLGETTKWGLPGHAEVGARFLQPWFDHTVVEPIRLHVAAKRYLTATDPDYRKVLSDASNASLAQQGGPFTVSEAQAFARQPSAAAAVRLRRWDDSGKTTGAGSVDVENFRPLITAALNTPNVSPMWARDACRCPDCRDPRNGQHLIGASDLTEWAISGSDRTEQEWIIDLHHSDGRLHRCAIPVTTYRPIQPMVLWGAEHSAQIRAAASDTDRFTTRLSAHGIALIEDIETEPGQVLDFAREIGFVRVTNYGELFDVVADDAPTNLAFTSIGLPLHTDNPYRDPVPTVQLLHCLRSADSGGGSLFSDGFLAAQQLRDSAPDAFDILTTTPARFEFDDAAVHLAAEVPLIRLDARGAVNRITVNNRSMQPVDIGDRTHDFYRAYLRFTELLAHPDNTISLDLAPGELIGFDNRRVLHGRSSFGPTGARHLQGCYIDMDAPRSVASLAAVGRIAQPLS